MANIIICGSNKFWVCDLHINISTDRLSFLGQLVLNDHFCIFLYIRWCGDYPFGCTEPNWWRQWFTQYLPTCHLIWNLCLRAFCARWRRMVNSNICNSSYPTFLCIPHPNKPSTLGTYSLNHSHSVWCVTWNVALESKSHVRVSSILKKDVIRKGVLNVEDFKSHLEFIWY